MSGIKKFFVFLIVGIFLYFAFLVSTCFFEPKTYDFMMKIFGANKTGSENIVIVVIDDDSIAKFRWPWKRELYANMFSYIQTQNPKVIIHDAIISSIDKDNPSSDRTFFKTVSGLENFIAGLEFTYKPYSTPATGKVVDNAYYDKYATFVTDKRKSITGFPYKSILGFPNDYYNALRLAAPVSCPQNFDGVTRDISLFVPYKHYLYPYLGFRAFLFANNDAECIVTDQNVTCPTADFYANKYQRFPGGNFNTPIRYYKMISDSYSHKTISAVKILEDYEKVKKGLEPELPADLFKDKFVILGANVKAASTGLSDILHTPIASRHSGTDVLATVLDNAQNNDFMKSLTFGQNFAVSLIIAFVVYILIRTRSIFFSLIAITALISMYFIIAGLCFYKGIAIHLITPIIVSVVTMIFGYLHRFLIEGQNKEKIKKAMGKYISDDIMERVVKNIDELKLGGKRATVTVLFADIRGFTSMSENLPAEEVSNILNEYFTEIEPIISKHNGIINKFIGDAVMAIFGEPILDKKHALNAVKCAQAMLKKVRKLQYKWMEEGKPRIEIGIGINTGEVFVGNIGSERRMEYTVIGDTVNLASRIESYNKIYKTNFLIGPSTYSEVKNYVDVIKISDVQIRGKAQRLDIYEILNVVDNDDNG